MKLASLIDKFRGKPRKEIVEKLKDKYRLLIINDDNLEEKFSFVLSPLNVFVWGGFTAISLIILVILVIAFTPLREYIPGYADLDMKKKATQALLRADSLQEVANYMDVYIQNIQGIINGDPIALKANIDSLKKLDYKKIENVPTKEDSLLRNLVELEDSYNISEADQESVTSLSKIYFFPPVKGVITASFDEEEKHFGVDIVSGKDEAIKCIADGTVISAAWTAEYGHVIKVQHSFNLISVYKHNSLLLKKEGDKVRAGDAISIIGNSGELTTGPHVHFEMWLEGKAVDPKKFMVL